MVEKVMRKREGINIDLMKEWEDIVGKEIGE